MHIPYSRGDGCHRRYGRYGRCRRTWAIHAASCPAAGTLAQAAPVAFASGFADAPTVSGVFALVTARVAYKLLTQPMRDGA
ncbi:hypothetical protein [Burkholderia metallica]